VSKYLKISFGIPIIANTMVLDLFVSILKDLFAVRLANYELRWNLKSVDWCKSCSVEGDTIKFSRNDYIARYLNKNGRLADQPEFNAMVIMQRARLTGDPRRWIHGHDFCRLLAHFVNEHRRSERLTEERVRQSLLCCLRPESLSSESMFKDLDHRLEESKKQGLEGKTN
jgi:hypothetical protein